TRIISVRKNEPFEISKDFFEKLLDEEIEIFKKKRNGKISDFELIESESMKTELNGYDTAKPFGKKAKTFKAYIYMSFGSEEVSKELKKIISEKFGEPRVHFQTLPFVAFNILEKIIKPEAGYLFADIGGEITDISLVRGGVLEETVSFPLGRNALVKEVASRFKTTIKEANSLIERFRKGHAGVSDSKKISPVAERVIGEWSGFLRKALAEISSKAPLPRDFFLAGSAIEGLGFVESVKGASFSGFTVLGKPFNAHRVLPEGLKHYFKFERSFEKDKDTFLMIESLFAAKVL
ncbi:MAG: hypothetical protein GXP44_03430, partial [bacterium]|nr:hypothetical protein [bacterium]